MLSIKGSEFLIHVVLLLVDSEMHGWSDKQSIT